MTSLTGRHCNNESLVDLCDECEYGLVTIGEMKPGKIYRISDYTRPIRPLSANLQETTGEVFYFRYVFICLEEPIPYNIGAQRCYTFKSIFVGTNEISHKPFTGRTVCIQTILPSNQFSFVSQTSPAPYSSHGSNGHTDTILLTIEEGQLIEEIE